MIEVEAEILRGCCTPVFFVGETIECEIRFRCVPPAQDKFIGRKNRQELELQQSVMRQKDKYLENSVSCSNLQQQETNRVSAHESESMFSVLSQSQISSPSSSIPSTPATSSTILPVNNLFYKSSKYARSFITDTTIGDVNRHQQDLADQEYTIAWSCAQIDCSCFIDESKVSLPKDPIRYGTYNENGTTTNGKSNSSGININTAGGGPMTGEVGNTSFQPNKDRVGISVYSSKPKILFCNMLLRPNETRSFIFKETLPYDLAPTFRGQFAKYSYKLTIGVQKLNKTTQMLRLPFRVYSLLDFEKYIPVTGPSITDDDEVNLNRRRMDSRSDSILSVTDSNNTTAGGGDLLNLTQHSIDLLNTVELNNLVTSANNPFRLKEKTEFENLEYSLQILEDLTARLSTSSYNVANHDGKIVKVSLNKTNYKIGDKLVVYLDFSESTVQCLEFKVTLQSEEIISEECRKKANQPLSSVHSHTEIKEYCLCMKKTDVTLQIPVHITPAFVSDIVSLRWRLHFEFALCKMSIDKIQKSNDPAMSVSWRSPASLPIEVLTWDLGLVIHPFDPFIASDLIYSNRAAENSLLLK